MKKINIGDIYWDCAYHPVLCTESDGDDVAGISLVDGSQPRSCSIKHCGVQRLTSDQVSVILQNRDLLMGSERVWRDRLTPTAYETFMRELEDSGVFPEVEERHDR